MATREKVKKKKKSQPSPAVRRKSKASLHAPVVDEHRGISIVILELLN